MNETTWEQRAQWIKDTFAKDGAFLISNKPDGSANPMTIGWGQIGVVWGRPVFTIYVRPSRYSYECLKGATEFAVSVPVVGELSKELLYCGTKSGRDHDKIADCNLALEDGKSIGVPILADCGLHFECKILARTDLGPSNIESEDVRRIYESKDIHQVLFGEILAAYTTKGSCADNTISP